jgi:type II secretory ATPase GspE/PulE/Tfp pilus assembly ATPase PilB-like protein
MNDELDPTPFLEVAMDNLATDQAVEQLIHQAWEADASDLYIHWNENDVSVCVRCLGRLRHLTTVSRAEGGRFVNYVKTGAEMNLAQKLHPLDGRWVRDICQGTRVDLRINTIPTLYGEDMAIHLLRRDAELMELENLGMYRRDLADLRNLLFSGSGLVLVTGPTGAGKTTTLYACLHALNDGTRKINTIEDPAEYVLEGVRQSQINPKINLDFPELLRSVLRQAPDVIMVGEIRDPVTAQTTVRAANSGHLVLATLHAPLSSGAIDSMLALDVHPHFLASSLEIILTQRLIRTLCDDCKIAFDLQDAPEVFDDVRPWLKPGQGETAYAPSRCEVCHEEGYTGRTGVFEMLRVGGEIRGMLAKRRPPREIRSEAVEKGMLDFRRSALLKVAEGVTSLEEVVREIPVEYLMPED